MEALDVLIDENADEGIMCRDDARLSASRHLYVARAASATIPGRIGPARPA